MRIRLCPGLASMPVLRRLLLWILLILIGVLIVLTIGGAFLGAQRAQGLFNSVPADVYWVVLTLSLVVGIMVFSRLRDAPGLLLIHAGCVLVLVGAIWGSEAGHGLQRRLLGSTPIRRAEMFILEGTREDRVQRTDGQFRVLPFALALDDFRIDYYRPAHLWVQMPNGRDLKIPANPGVVQDLDAGLGQIKILRTFENFKIVIDPNGRTAYDDPNAGSNPAVEVQVIRPDGTIQRQFAFDRYPQQHGHEGDLILSYRRSIKDYISQVRVVTRGMPQKAIEVNRPFHYGGYYFYQSSYGLDAETNKPYTVLTVVCDCGLNLVYLGYIVLFVGLAWHLWLGRLNAQRPTCRVENNGH
jgi:hypothetical protein